MEMVVCFSHKFFERIIKWNHSAQMEQDNLLEIDGLY